MWRLAMPHRPRQSAPPHVRAAAVCSARDLQAPQRQKRSRTAMTRGALQHAGGCPMLRPRRATQGTAPTLPTHRTHTTTVERLRLLRANARRPCTPSHGLARPRRGRRFARTHNLFMSSPGPHPLEFSLARLRRRGCPLIASARLPLKTQRRKMRGWARCLSQQPHAAPRAVIASPPRSFFTPRPIACVPTVGTPRAAPGQPYAAAGGGGGGGVRLSRRRRQSAAVPNDVRVPTERQTSGRID